MATVDSLQLERRRWTRVECAEDCQVMLDESIPVRVVDVSRSGILVTTKTPLPVHARAALSVVVRGRSFNTMVEIRHASVDRKVRAGTRYRAGAAFAPLDVEQRVQLEQLLGTERR